MKTGQTKSELEGRRMVAADMFERGFRNVDVARILGVSAGAVSQWRKALRTSGKEGLKSKRHPGRQSKLTPENRTELADLLLAGPTAHGFPTELWTLPRIAELIRMHFGISYDPSNVWRIMKSMGWSAQKPQHVAREQNEDAVRQWRDEEWPRIKREATSKGHSVAFLDESGFMLRPVVRRTWAPRGKTPVMKTWQRHERATCIAAITVSPKRQLPRVYFRMQRHNTTTEDVTDFLLSLRRSLGRPMVVVLDRLGAHRSAAKRLGECHGDDFTFEFLPAYSPELNPVESLWSHTKYVDLANYTAKDLDALEESASSSIRAAGGKRTLLNGFIRHTGLSLAPV